MDRILEVKNCRKNFGPVVALNRVDISVSRGKIHFIIGENGAGKSTLMKIISGVYSYEEYDGDIIFQGVKCKYKTIKDSEKDGIVIIHQELALSPYLSIYENLFLGNERRNGFIINWDKTVEDARKILDKVGLKEDLQTPINKISIAKQQLVEIAKALSKNAKLLILDEPTSSLNEEDSQILLNLLLKLKEEGVTIIMISHKLNEVIQIADEFTIIRDGDTIERINFQENRVGVDYIIKRMVGRELVSLYPTRNSNISDTILELKNITVRNQNNSDNIIIKNADLVLKKGEIIGVGGLIGSGRTELMLTIFGKSISKNVTGEIFFEEKKINWSSPKEAIENGVIYVSEDRKDLGVILIQTIKNNMCYSSLKKISKYGVINQLKECEKSNELKEKLKVKTPTIEQLVGKLSGGNQQKVVLARCLMAEPKLLIIDEPTRGIDIGAKNEIYKIMNEFVEKGNSIIMISSELPELLGMTDRIYIMDKGEIKGEILTKDATQEKIMKIALS